MLATDSRTIYDVDLEIFRDQVRKFLDRAHTPNLDRWEQEGIVDREFWRAAGEAGLLCPTVAEAYGGLGLDFRYNAVIDEELYYAGSPTHLCLQSDIIVDYIERYGSEDQKHKWLPRMISGETVAAIAMTEPGAGSDLQGVRTTARREGGNYIINGAKTYISNGQNADLVIVVAKTDPDAGSRGISLILVEATREGFTRGRNLDKIGQNGADTSELFFQDLCVPAANLLGEEGKGFGYLMAQLPQERLSIAVMAQASAQRAFDEAVKFTKERKAFGQTVFDFQNTRFTLAGLKAKMQAGWAHLDWAMARHLQGKLTAAEASAAKLFHTELQWEVCDAALQLHGGAGYMNEYPIARLWRDARVQRIYGGTSEIMKEVVARSI
ncbi:acyl-CoA dehydrogenase family protein [Rhizorhabdus dicambivorans]|uniref:Acyl-CoA dehydrogenase n=1 Tax=Rhizorhabdus dicambivorans TaxID=1850238 RepID=A0A2A4FVB2_9SPHN|nr:acyl-CoA dehydrogenase family protein [Rhizorhabdus dicambivorans]ATE64727.1 acyl-CoA dehydrogenase [Rhizorhabdus dicambivorans]PCE41331.1 acyl-CoA dehydrogenase [Rhizorhabdus dicambivorans]